jgi:hypothetical protein
MSGGAHTAEITRPAARQHSFFTGALKATIAFAAGAIARIIEFGAVGVTLDAQFAGHDAVSVLIQLIVTVSGSRRDDGSRYEGDADSRCGGEGE